MRFFALVLAASCGGTRVEAQPEPLSPADLCAAGAGESACAPGGVCVETAGAWLVCTCCASTGGFAVTAFSADSSPADCARTREHWLTVCPLPHHP